jgi:hypothetical protein
MTRKLDKGPSPLVVTDRLMEFGAVEWLIRALSAPEAGLERDRARSFDPGNQPFAAAAAERIARQWDGGPCYQRSTSTKV